MENITYSDISLALGKKIRKPKSRLVLIFIVIIIIFIVLLVFLISTGYLSLSDPVKTKTSTVPPTAS